MRGPCGGTCRDASAWQPAAPAPTAQRRAVVLGQRRLPLGDWPGHRAAAAVEEGQRSRPPATNAAARCGPAHPESPRGASKALADGSPPQTVEGAGERCHPDRPPPQWFETPDSGP
jgi:hypothetical protein